MQVFDAGGDFKKTELRFSSSWVCPYDGTPFREPTPALFSFKQSDGRMSRLPWLWTHDRESITSARCPIAA